MSSIELTSIDIPGPTILQQVRTSKLKPLGTVLSGIDKKQREGRLFVSRSGLPEDEHDLTFHGGVDKAIHQYCSDNYAYWQATYPEKASEGVFTPGGFGENLVADGINEENICIGDLVRIAPEGCGDKAEACILEVSLPRQPCFKLNQRFGIKNFAPKTHQAAKTGWYYRVKQDGYIEPGMEIRVVRRDHPKWSIARLHHYVHREKANIEAARELMDVDVLGNECRNIFRKRWEQFQESQKPRKIERWRPFKVVEKKNVTRRTVALTLQAQEHSEEASNVSFNSFVSIRLLNGLRRSYSVVGGTANLFTLGVARDDNSRGGSTYIHDKLLQGDMVHVGEFHRSMEPNGMASHAIFIVGGIGITAFLAMMKLMKAINQTFELHYAVRTNEEVAFKPLLAELGPDIHTYSKADGQRMDVTKILRERVWNSQAFVCGPQRMIDAVVAAAAEVGMAEDEVMFESFSADTTGDPFSADIFVKDEKKMSLEIGPEQTLLQVMREAGFDMPSSCEVGTCGTCRIRVKSGRVEHRGSGLTGEEKESEMLCCVSRGIGHITVEDPTSVEE